MTTIDTAAAWRVGDLEHDKSWVCEIDDQARRDLSGTLEKAATRTRACSTTGKLA